MLDAIRVCTTTKQFSAAMRTAHPDHGLRTPAAYIGELLRLRKRGEVGDEYLDYTAYKLLSQAETRRRTGTRRRAVGEPAARSADSAVVSEGPRYAKQTPRQRYHANAVVDVFKYVCVLPTARVREDFESGRFPVLYKGGQTPFLPPQVFRYWFRCLTQRGMSYEQARDATRDEFPLVGGGGPGKGSPAGSPGPVQLKLGVEPLCGTPAAVPAATPPPTVAKASVEAPASVLPVDAVASNVRDPEQQMSQVAQAIRALCDPKSVVTLTSTYTGVGPMPMYRAEVKVPGLSESEWSQSGATAMEALQALLRSYSDIAFRAWGIRAP